MSFHRVLYLCGWTAVALLAIVGFAAFSTNSPTSPPPAVAVQPSWGLAAGAVSGQGWLALGGTGETAAVVATAPPTSEAPAANPTVATDTDLVAVDTGWLDSVAVRELVATYFASGDVNRAVRLAWCVSRFDVDAVSPKSGAAGLFQIHPTLWEDLIVDAEWQGTASIFDPEASTAMAAFIVYQGDGWGYWDCQG